MALQYNAFGLTYDNIISSFKDSISSDFETNGKTAQDIIEFEMEMAELEILSRLPADIASKLDRVEGLVLFPNQSHAATIEFPITTNVTAEVIKGCCGNESRESTLVTVSGKTLTFPNISYGDKVAVSFDVDKENWEIPEYKKIIRDRVCCVIGSYLYSREESEWKLVTRYCDMADAAVFNVPRLFTRQEWIDPTQPGLRIVKSRRA